MKKIIGISNLVLVLLSTAALAAETGISSTTLFGFQERSVPGFNDRFQPTGTEFLGINAADNEQRLSINFFGWGRADLREPGKNGDGDLTTGFLNYRFPKSNAYVRLGRFYQFNVTGVEQVDGASVRTDIGRYAGISLFGGAPVRTEFDVKGNFIYGGKLELKVPKYLEVGVSALSEDGGKSLRSDETVANRRQEVGGNVLFSPHQMFDLQGNASYNLVTEGLQEQRYTATVRPSNAVTFSGDFRDYRFEHYFASTNIPWLFNPEPDGKLQSFGGMVNLRPASGYELTGLFKHYRRYGGETANFNRYGAQTRYNREPFTAGLHYYRVDGQERDLRYHEFYGYGVLTQGKTTWSLDASTHVYDVKIYNESLDFRINGSVGYKLTKELEVTGGLSYATNPHLNDDFSGSIWLTYNAQFNSKR